MLAQMFVEKLSPNLETASRLLRSPLGQALVSFLLGYLATTKLSQIYGKLREDSLKSQASEEEMKLYPKNDTELIAKGNDILLLTQKELTAFDGSNPDQPIYTAVNGMIYDLSPGREKFSSHGPYSFLAGCDANKVLNIACGSMGVCAPDVINRWERSLKAEFNVIGLLIDADVENMAEVPESKEEMTFSDQTRQINYV
ncbi:membrane steroid-binding protein 2 [Drosophila ficusphila]|uniref:membrane steroid-binding protein 2 n=1 Tax=Drosophila ficusphila TaxID=30025 RepID=UPI0007E88A97|nr:membrane steroid-binding protein 2 [Drosophila ficusphila]